MNEHLKMGGKNFLGSLILTHCGIGNKIGIALLPSVLNSLRILLFMCCMYRLHSPAKRNDIFFKPFVGTLNLQVGTVVGVVRDTGRLEGYLIPCCDAAVYLISPSMCFWKRIHEFSSHFVRGC